MYPIFPDHKMYPFGRDLGDASVEIGLAGRGLKPILHPMFLHKAKRWPLRQSLLPRQRCVSRSST